MKIRDILNKDTATISFEVFPPKKSTDFGNVEAAALGIAALQPAYMSVTYGAGGSTKGHTIALAREIQKQYNVPTVAHLTCACADTCGSHPFWMLPIVNRVVFSISPYCCISG